MGALSQSLVPTLGPVRTPVLGAGRKGLALAERVRRALFGAEEQGVMYVPKDFERYISAKGPERVTNGTFADGLTGWTVIDTAPGTTVLSGGAVVMSNNATGTSLLRQALSVPAASYEVTFTVTGFSGATNLAQLAIGNTTSGDTTYSSVGINANGTYRQVVKANAGTLGLAFIVVSGTATTATIDNVSVRELTALDTATLFEDSAGTIPVTRMEQSVGLILDQRLGLVETEIPVPSTGWTLGTGITFDSVRTLTFNATAAGARALRNGVYTSGARATVRVTATGTGNVTIYANGGSGAVTSNTLSGGSQTFSASSAGTNGFVIVDAGPAGFTGTVVIERLSEIRGNHATQPTTSLKPVLSARKNLLLNSENVGTWVTTITGAATRTLTPTGFESPTGTMNAGRFQASTNGSTSNDLAQVVLPGAGGTTGVSYTDSVYLKSNTGLNQSVVFVSLDGVVSAPVTITPEWQRFQRTAIGAGSGVGFRIRIVGNEATSQNLDILVWGGQREEGTTATRYQRVTTATDYDWQGFPMYLRSDGFDDFMQTGSINFTGTDKMTVCAGVRKLSDAALGQIVSLGAGDVSSVNGSFALWGPGGAGATSYRFDVRGDVVGGTGFTATTFTAPVSSVLSVGLDIAGAVRADEVMPRVNGVIPTLAAVGSASAGAGNFGNYSLYLFRRGGTSLPFNGLCYGLVIRGALTAGDDLANLETFIAEKTGVTLP